MARVWLFGDNVDTDQIVPGRYAPYMTSEEELLKYPFVEARPEFAVDVRPGDVIVAGSNFGCGSSREYAPRALVAVGIAAIIAPSYARIFFRNALNLGLPLFEADLTQHLEDGQQVTLDVARGTLIAADEAFQLPPPPAWVARVWRAGGMVAYYRQHGAFPLEEAHP
ncbi:MAG: homoaconitate hydratase [Anaerolineae bacterium]